MRPGPGLAALTGGVAIGGRVDVYRAGRAIATDVPVTDVVYDWTAARVVPGQVTYTAPADWVPVDAMSPLANMGQRTHLWSIVDVAGERVEVELGWFLHQSWEESDKGVEVTATDLMQVVEDSPASWPSSPPAGATFLSELRRLAQMPVTLDDQNDFRIPRTYEWGYSRTEAIRDLCDSYGCGYGVKPDGYLHVWPVRRGAPVAAYSAEDLLIDAPRKSTERRPNRWLVVGNGQRQQGTERDQVIAQDYATSKSREGWQAREVTAEWSWPVVASGGRCLRATWRVEPGARMTNPGLTLSKAVAKTGTKVVTLWTRAATTADVLIEAWDGDSKAAETRTTGGDTWQKSTLTIPDKRKFTRIRIYQVGGVGTGHWIDVDEIMITRSWVTTKTTTVKGKRSVQRTPHQETLLHQTFVDGGVGPWSTSKAAISWTYPEAGGQYKAWLQARWGGLQGNATGHIILTWTPKERVSKDGRKHVDFWIRSNTADQIHIRLWAGEVLADSKDLKATGWTRVTLAVGDGLVLSSLTIEQDGDHWSDHWIGLDQVNVWRDAPHMVDARFTATAQALDPPYDTASYGVVTARTELSAAVTQQQVTDAANEALRKRLMSQTVRPLGIVPDPRLEGGDLISCTTDTGEVIVGQVTAYSLPVSEPEALMRVDVEVHEW